MRTLYWLTFLLTILILFQNVGIVLLGLGIFILPVIILHVLVVRKLEDIEHKRLLVGVSAINLLLFSLLRPEGAHAIYMTGLSSVLDLIGISGTYNSEHENFYVSSSLILLVVQVIVDLRLMKVSILNR